MTVIDDALDVRLDGYALRTLWLVELADIQDFSLERSKEAAREGSGA